MKSKHSNKKAKPKHKGKLTAPSSPHPPVRNSRSESSISDIHNGEHENQNENKKRVNNGKINRGAKGHRRRSSLAEKGMESLRETVFNISMLILAMALLLLFLYVVNELREDAFDDLDS